MFFFVVFLLVCFIISIVIYYFFFYSFIYLFCFHYRDLDEEEPFFDIIDYTDGNGTIDIRMSTSSYCENDACFNDSKLVFSETKQEAFAHREAAYIKCSESTDMHFVKYQCH